MIPPDASSETLSAVSAAMLATLKVNSWRRIHVRHVSGDFVEQFRAYVSSTQG